MQERHGIEARQRSQATSSRKQLDHTREAIARTLNNQAISGKDKSTR